MTTSVGSLTNVPAPGDDVTSLWAQQVSALAIHPFASLSALKVAWPTAPENAWAYLMDEMSLVVGKSGTWRWYRKTFPVSNGDTQYVTYGPLISQTAAWTTLSINGRTLLMQANFAPTAAQTTGILLGTIPVGFRTTSRVDTPCACSVAAGAYMGRVSNDAGTGTINVTRNDAQSATGFMIAMSWSVADLVVAV